MGQMITIAMSDGLGLGAYASSPTSGESKGAVVVIQEIFGVNAHIREVADGYAAKGYTVIAPALFDRIDSDIQLGYTEADMGTGIGLAFEKLQMPQTLADLQSVVDYAGEQGSVGVVGYCFGGLPTYLSAGNTKGATAAFS